MEQCKVPPAGASRAFAVGLLNWMREEKCTREDVEHYLEETLASAPEAAAEPQGFNLAGTHRCCNEWPECGHMLAWYERLKQRVPNERLTQILEAETLWCGDCETQSLADEMLILRDENATLRARLDFAERAIVTSIDSARYSAETAQEKEKHDQT